MPNSKRDGPGAVKKKALDRRAALAVSEATRQVIRAGEEPPEPDHLPVEGHPAYERRILEPKDHQTVADKLDYVVDSLGGRYERRVLKTGVALVIILPDGTQIGGKGTDNIEAFNALLKNVQAFVKAGLAQEVDK